MGSERRLRKHQPQAVAIDDASCGKYNSGLKDKALGYRLWQLRGR